MDYSSIMLRRGKEEYYFDANSSNDIKYLEEVEELIGYDLLVDGIEDETCINKGKYEKCNKPDRDEEAQKTPSMIFNVANTTKLFKQFKYLLQSKYLSEVTMKNLKACKYIKMKTGRR